VTSYDIVTDSHKISHIAGPSLQTRQPAQGYRSYEVIIHAYLQWCSVQ